MEPDSVPEMDWAGMDGVASGEVGVGGDEVAGLIHDGGGDGKDGGEEAAGHLVDVECFLLAAYAGISVEDFLQHLGINGSHNLLRGYLP